VSINYKKVFTFIPAPWDWSKEKQTEGGGWRKDVPGYIQI